MALPYENGSIRRYETVPRNAVPSGDVPRANGANYGSATPQEPAYEDAHPDRADSRFARSDRIAYLSAALVFLVLLVRFRFPDYAKDLQLELRYLLSLFASCFTLGISGWFQHTDRDPTRVDSIYTIMALVLLVMLWDLVLSGNLAAVATKALPMLWGVRPG